MLKWLIIYGLFEQSSDLSNDSIQCERTLTEKSGPLQIRARILVQVTIYRRLLIGRDGHLDQSEAYDILDLVLEYGSSALYD